MRDAYVEAYSHTEADPWFRYTAASGMSDFTSDDKDANLVFERADSLMYEDKMKFKKENGQEI